MVDKEGETSNRHNEELHAECVVVAVIGGPELHVHQVHGQTGGGDEEQLHAGVVQRHKVGEKIQVTSSKNQGKHDLTLA